MHCCGKSILLPRLHLVVSPRRDWHALSQKEGQQGLCNTRFARNGAYVLGLIWLRAAIPTRICKFWCRSGSAVIACAGMQFWLELPLYSRRALPRDRSGCICTQELFCDQSNANLHTTHAVMQGFTIPQTFLVRIHFGSKVLSQVLDPFTPLC